MADTPKTTKAIVLKDFTDAGTEENFTASNDPVDIESGAFANYQAAGLVSVVPAPAVKPAA